MMQRVLHINSEYKSELWMLSDKFTIAEFFKLRKIIVITFEFDNFFEFNDALLKFLIKTTGKKVVFNILWGEIKYFNLQEQSLIFERVFGDLYTDEYREKISRLTASQNILNTEGIFYFACHGLYEGVKSRCLARAEELILESEYIEFVKNLRFFSRLNYGNAGIVHLVFKKDNSIELLDENFKPYIKDFEGVTKYENAFLNEFNIYDNVISALVEASPEIIVIHGWKNHDSCDIIETITDIFDERAVLCKGCIHCSD